MTWKNYSIVCAAAALLTVLALLIVPGFSELVEQLMLLFLSTNAR